MRKRFATAIVKNVSMIVLVAGAAVTAVGAGMIYLPAGVHRGRRRGGDRYDRRRAGHGWCCGSHVW